MTRSDPLEFLRNLKDPSRKTFLRVSSETKNIRKISSRVMASLERHNVDEGRIFDIRLCIEEAVRNAMVHGNRSDRSLPVKVSYWIGNGSLTMEIEDAGDGFNAAAVADPTDDANVTKNSGRGVYLIRKLMDRVEYNEKGNKVTMTKKLK